MAKLNDSVIIYDINLHTLNDVLGTEFGFYILVVHQNLNQWQYKEILEIQQDRL